MAIRLVLKTSALRGLQVRILHPPQSKNRLSPIFILRMKVQTFSSFSSPGWARATTIPRTSFAPDSFKILAASSIVAPVV